MLLATAVLAALPIGYFCGGRLRNYLSDPLKMVLLPCLAFVFEASFGLLAEVIPWPVNYWLGSAVFTEYVLLAIFIYLNRKSRGIGILGLGMLANFAAIADNGFCMPVSPIIYRFPDAIETANRIAQGDVIGYVLVDWDASLWFLGDTIPLLNGLASVGDILMAVGLVILIVAKMKPVRPEKPAA